MKDPAFLFYSKDFYEGTRMMLPEERACYVDLLIFQHQHGLIPNDLRRIMMYVSGVDEATLKATLKAKFIATDEGWYNQRLKDTIEERAEYTAKQSSSGKIGQFFKKAKAQLKTKEYSKLRDYIYNEYGKENLLFELNKKEGTHEGLLKALLKHLANVNAIEDVNKDIDNNEGEEEFSFRNSLLEIGVKENIATDWLLVRKNKKAVNTETAFKRIKAQIEKCGYPANDCIELAASKSWIGFEAKYLDDFINQNKKSYIKPSQESRQDVYDRILEAHERNSKKQ